ncbi:MAG TPA: phytanoyl-CoA dioxygenase family protein [Chitinophagaceae bacterium]|nr:phytanoyl-CoA dioxygenase family protein [Chitinophagaceae bacterium]
MEKWKCDFTLDDQLKKEHINFFKKFGVIVFRKFLSPEKVKICINEIQKVQGEWIDEKKDKVNGIPLKYGKDENGNPTIQRLCFMSLFSNSLHEILKDEKIKNLTGLLCPYEGRIAENEKDGLVVNNYINTPGSSFNQMGWHTDSPRDLFAGQRILPMLNVGIHLDTCLFDNGGLRIIPGTHHQNIFRLLFRKKYFMDNKPDNREVGFDIFSGDLTVHDGRVWHRVQKSPLTGEASRRRVMYIPIITGKYKPKNEKSKTPFYHLFTRKAHH